MRVRPTKKKSSQFKGIDYFLAESFICQSLPENFKGLDPASFALDRWKPLGRAAKVQSKDLIERNLGWVKTGDDMVVYGTERWGELIPSNYLEWFSVVIIHPKILQAEAALNIASLTNPVGQKGDGYG